MQPFSQLLDDTYKTKIYSQALKTMLNRTSDVDETLSVGVIEDTIEYGGTWGFGSHLAVQHAAVYETHKLSKKTLAYFDEVAKISIQNQQQLEEDNSKSFKEYLTDYR